MLELVSHNAPASTYFGLVNPVAMLTPAYIVASNKNAITVLINISALILLSYIFV